MDWGTLRFRFIVAAMVIAVVGASNRYMAGDEGGWRTPGDDTPDLYRTWASKIRFQVGDSIEFRYRNDSVVMVSKRGYYHCNETAHGSSSSFRDGNTVFLLERPGFYYFVSGDLEHCKKGQRLMIQVAGPTPGGPSPSPLPSTVAPCPFPPLLVVLVLVGVVLLPSTLF